MLGSYFSIERLANNATVCLRHTGRYYSRSGAFFSAKVLHVIVLSLVFICTASPQAWAQYYHTGTTLLTDKKTAPHIKMRLHSSGIMFSSGATGTFGVSSHFATDTITCWGDGYDTLTVAVFAGRQNQVWMQENEHVAKLRAERGRLSNLTPQLKIADEHYYARSGETYAALVENQMVATSLHPETGISPHSNKAAYANVRRFIQNGQQIPPHAVRTEELINYFSLSLAPPPVQPELFSIATTLTDCPWNEAHKMLHINARARAIETNQIPPANLVFLIDNSGSMDMPNRLPLLKSAFGMLVNALRAQDRVAIVTYGGMAGVWMPPTMGTQKDTILKYIQTLEAGGATAGSGGIRLAYELATTMPMPEANSRVILATDGDFNVGITAEKELEDLIINYRQSGVKLTCLGVGMGNLKDSKIEALARHGHGNYAYLDNEQEAEKVLVNELSENLYSLVNNATVQVLLNPAHIHSYQLIGYENKRGALTEENARLVGGDIGAGFSMNLLFEIKPVSMMADTASENSKAGGFSLLFSTPDQARQDTLQYAIPYRYVPLTSAPHASKMAVGIAFFSHVLRKSPATQHLNMNHVQSFFQENLPANNTRESELQTLIEKATVLYKSTAPGGKKGRGKTRN